MQQFIHDTIMKNNPAFLRGGGCARMAIRTTEFRLHENTARMAWAFYDYDADTGAFAFSSKHDDDAGYDSYMQRRTDSMIDGFQMVDISKHCRLPSRRSEAERHPELVEGSYRGNNNGQIRDTEHMIRSDVFFTAKVQGTTLHFMRNAVSYVFTKEEETGKSGNAAGNEKDKPSRITSCRMDMTLEGANPDVAPEGIDEGKSTSWILTAAC
jgi:hypothetical protein